MDVVRLPALAHHSRPDRNSAVTEETRTILGFPFLLRALQSWFSVVGSEDIVSLNYRYPNR